MAIWNYKNILTVFILSLLVQACMYPGEMDLQQQGVKGSVVLRGDYKAMANCVAKAGDQEEYRLGELQAVSNVFRLDEREKTVEVGNTITPGGVYLWLAKFRQKSANKVELAVTARGEGFPGARDTDYFVQKIEKFAKSCQR